MERTYRQFESNINIKGFTPILILLILTISIAGFFGYKYLKLNENLSFKPSPQPSVIPTPDPTTDWKIYINEKYDFSFKYPTEASFTFNQKGIVGDYEGANVKFTKGQSQHNYVDSNGYSLSVYVYDGNTAKNLLKEWDNYSKTNCYAGFICSDLVETTIDGIISKTYSLQDEKLKITNYLINNNAYLFAIEIKYAGWESNKNTVNQILSTFKFTN